MIVLDTNVLSALMQDVAESSVVGWLDQQAPESLWTTSVTVFEVRYGLAAMPKGKRQKSLAAAFDEALARELEGRVLDFDATAAGTAAMIAARLRAQGRSVEIRDVMIAGIVSSRRGVLATRNVKHFEGAEVTLVNPWK